MHRRDHIHRERSNLGFPEAVRTGFHFLHGYGFSEVSAGDTIVCYATEQVFLNIYHGRSSYELGAEIGLVSGGRGGAPGYSLSALIRLKNHEEAERFRYFMATTPGDVTRGVQNLAEQLLTYGERALKGDKLVFDALERQRLEYASMFADNVAYRQVSPRAAEAFRQREYRKAAELYESIRGKLSPVELKKLLYAKKHA